MEGKTMKKNTIIAAIAAASALLLCASCQKQEIQEQNSGINAGGKVFTATIEQALTKTTITNEYKVNWVEGDKVSINGVEYTAVPDSNDPTKAALTPPAEGSAAPVDDKYYAVYPASIMVETVPTLPATQIYTAGQFNAPMYAESGTETFTFKNICGVLCLSLNGTDKVKSIAVTANEQICGPFEFIDAESFCFSGENEGYTVTLDCGEGVQLSSNSSTNFYVYLPPFESCTAGMKIVVTNTEGKTFEKTTTTAVKIERNNIYTFNWTAAFAPVIPTGALPGEFSVSATKKVQFTKGNLYYDGSALNFEASQYAFNSSYESSHVSFFTWSSTVAAAAGTSNSGDNLFCDENHKVSVNGSEAIYYALSKDE